MNGRKERIGLHMDGMQIVMVMSEGNPGAMMACMELLKQTAKIDPDNALGGIGALLSCDTLGLYGSRLYMLANDVCGRDFTKVVAVLRGWQLGIVPEAVVNHAVDHRGDGLDLDDVLAKVRERLPAFGPIAL